jgi:hypothetical protein
VGVYVPLSVSTADRSSDAGLRAWSVLFGCLAAAGGHGVLLLAALLESGALDQIEAVGRGRGGALAIAWLLACPAWALLGLFLRRPLMRSRFLAPLAIGVAGVTVVAFRFYLAEVAG